MLAYFRLFVDLPGITVGTEDVFWFVNANRGRGYGSAITLALMQEAHERGYQRAWVWSSPMGKRVYSKLGFVAADFGIREYQWKKH